MLKSRRLFERHQARTASRILKRMCGDHEYDCRGCRNFSGSKCSISRLIDVQVKRLKRGENSNV